MLPCNSASTPDWNDVRYAVVIARCGSLGDYAVVEDLFQMERPK